MGRRYRGQQEPVPERVAGWADPLIFELAAVVQRLDVSGFEADYRSDGVGGLPYEPGLMLVTVFWCYRQGIRSPQAMARACREQVSLRVVWQRDRLPSAAALRRFIGGHPQAWQSLFVSVLALGDRSGLLDASLTATDSTPVAVPAALSTAVPAATITVRIAEAEQQLQALRERLAVLADTDVAGFVEHSARLLRAEQLLLVRLDRLHQAETHARQQARDKQQPAHGDQVRRWQDRVERHRHELDAMRAAQQQKYDAWTAKRAAGHKPRGPAPHPPEQHPHIRAKTQALQRAQNRLDTARHSPAARDGPTRASTTDPQARVLKGKNVTRWVLGRLLTLTVTGGQLITAALLSPHANDYPGLFPNLAATATNCAQAGITSPFGHHLADSGFASIHALTQPAPIQGTLLICVTSEHHQTHGHLTTVHTEHRQHMAARLATPDNQTRYRRRSPMIEPVFAHLLRTDRHLHTRGNAQHSEILALTAAYNTSKILKTHQPHNTRTGTRLPKPP
ncbi:hypothetical protein HH310_42960 [Actinoplanes sp. TBRC 11911]|uniref:hypothetical protein n=1 Tax=Actinoplanes sp. TBRC 11911 TaxID=2729386 RepID=UPI00145C7923|nr:hypothetical protein [Actinoplanes sp. TBRC 11911]NMO57907.1 hypothetical protein [Actinoplanes sp. TBRC 11911]